MRTIPESVLTAIRAGWQYESTDPLEVVSVSAIEAGELASLTRAGSTGCEDLVEALDALPAGDVVYDVTDDVASRAVYAADGTQVWALS